MSMNGNENISQPIEADIFHQMTISTTPKIIILKRKKERKKNGKMNIHLV